MTQTIVNTNFQFADDKTRTFRVYNICGDVLCACELCKNGEYRKASTKTLKAVAMNVWTVGLETGFIIIK